jgi:beta-glucosidase
VAPLWPFGFGLSYTSFRVDRLFVDHEEIATSGGEATIRVDVENTGVRAGDEVIQLYVRDVEASVARPVLELRGFRRVSLQPGECRTVSFTISAEQFAYVGADHRRVVEPGTIAVHVGTSSVNLPVSTTIRLVGPTVELRDRRRYLTETALA